VAIDTHEELVNALHVACEIEHGLMIQYRQAESGPKSASGRLAKSELLLSVRSTG
jgi:hypothetical protein